MDIKTISEYIGGGKVEGKIVCVGFGDSANDFEIEIEASDRFDLFRIDQITVKELETLHDKIGELLGFAYDNMENLRGKRR